MCGTCEKRRKSCYLKGEAKPIRKPSGAQDKAEKCVAGARNMGRSADLASVLGCRCFLLSVELG
jgi:hypothetical protein